MKKFKKLVAMIMALGMVSSMGISVCADTIGESQETYYAGDVNLDGKVNGVDLVLLKKMILGLIDMQKMYIDGDSLKLVDDTTVTTDDNDYYTINTMESTFMMGSSEYNNMGYVVDLEENYIKVQVDTVGGSDYGDPVYLILIVTDDTIFNAEATTLEELANLGTDYCDYVFTYNNKQELVRIAQIEVSSQQPPIMTYTSDNAKFYFNTSGNTLDIILNDDYDSPIGVQVTDDTNITLDGIPITLDSIAKAQDDIDISISYQYDTTTGNYVALNIVGESTTKDIQEITIYYGSSDVIDSINTDEKTIVLGNELYNQLSLYYINDDTTYTGIVSSIDDLSEYQGCYLSVVLEPDPDGDSTYVTDIEMYYFWVISYYTNANSQRVITNIDITRNMMDY